MWILFSLLCAISLSVSDLLSKIALRLSDIYLVSWVKVAFASLFLLFIVPFIRLPLLTPRFFRICVILFPLEVTALLLYVKAIKLSPLSLTVPFLSLTPLFLIATSYLILGERLDSSGIAGIILIVFGSYILNFGQAYSGIWKPIEAIFRERGSWLMIIVAAIYSINSNLGKIAIQETDPVFFSLFLNAVLTILITPFPLLFSPAPIKGLKRQFWLFLGIGGAMASMTLFHMLALIRIEVAYMISIKRTSPIFSVILGHLILSEGEFRERLTGCIIMFAGVLLILL